MKRPWRVRWWSYHWNVYFSKSYAYEDRAYKLAQRLLNKGVDKVQVWHVDHNWIRVLTESE